MYTALRRGPPPPGPPPPPHGPPIHPDGDNDSVMLKVFVAFLFTGGIGNIAMLLTGIFSSRVTRHITWISFCASWVIFSFSYTLLFIANESELYKVPSYPLCLTQAALIYGAPVIVAYATLSLIAQVALSARSLILFHVYKPLRYQTPLLVILPYATWFAVWLNAVISGIRYPETVARNMDDGGLYCEITSGIPGKIVAVLVGVAMIFAFALETSLGVALYSNWKTLGDQRSKLPMSMMIRVAVFLCVSILAFSTVFVFLSRRFAVSNIVISLLPFFSFLVFGTQRDIINVWTFHRCHHTGS